MLAMTRVPRAGAHLRGVVNLRGRIIPVVDLGRILGMGERADAERACIVITRIDQAKGGEGLVIGVLVDEVSDVLDVGADMIEPTPQLDTIDTELIQGLGKIGPTVVMALDVDKLLSASSEAELEAAALGERSGQ